MHLRLALILAALASCTDQAETAVRSAALLAPAATVNARDFGAIGDGVTDDRLAIQTALDSGAATVYIPEGSYLVSQRPGSYYALLVNHRVELRGESRGSVTLLLAGGAGPSVQLVWVEAAHDVAFRSLTLDGQRDLQSVNQQRHGIFAKQATGLVIDDVEARGFTGDGTHIHDHSDHVLVRNSTFRGNARNGLTLGGETDDTTFVDDQFIGNGAEQLDSEHGHADHVSITGCAFDTLGASNDYVITMTGGSAEARSTGWTVTGNTVNGSVLMLWIKDVVYAHNTGVNASTKPAVFVYRSVDDVLIYGNTLHTTGVASFDEGSMVHVVGTNPGQSPGGVVVKNNTLTTEHAAYGVSAICARDVQVLDNVITGAPGTRYESGVFVRATRELEPVRSANIERNTITGFSGYGVRLGGNGAAQILNVAITGNTIAGGAAALNLNDGYDEARDVTASGNTATEQPMLVNPPAGVAMPWGDGTRWISP